MRNAFAEYYRPNFEALWNSATISFDASALLDLYRFSVTSRDELLRLMSEFQDRIWIPHQAAQEFHENRITVIEEVHKASDIVSKHISGALETLEKESKQHPYISADLVSRISPRLTEVLRDLEKARTLHPDLLSEDTLGEKIADLLDGRVGQPYPQEKFAALCNEIDSRNDAKIPPGYMDLKTKGKERARGDGFVWFQLMDFAQANQKSILFITRDSKEDWWLLRHGRILQPRPELRREFKSKTSQDFYAYTILNFIETAKEHGRGSVSAALIAEAQEIATRSDSSTTQLVRDASMRSGAEQLIVRPHRLRRVTPYELVTRQTKSELNLLRSRLRRTREEIHAVRAELAVLHGRGDQEELSPLQQRSLAELQSRLSILRHRSDEYKTRTQILEARLLEVGVGDEADQTTASSKVENTDGL